MNTHRHSSTWVFILALVIFAVAAVALFSGEEHDQKVNLRSGSGKQTTVK